MNNKEKELLRLYGEFLSRYEFVCSRLRFSILYLLYPNYDTTERNICEIMTEGLTADPLRKKFCALIIERYTKKSDLFKSADMVSKIFLDLLELRNSFAHGTAFIGEYDFISETQKGRLVIRHPKIRSGGLDLNFKEYDSVLLKALLDILFRLEKAIRTITIIIRHYDKKDSFKNKYNTIIQNDLATINVKSLLKKKE
jgi:hypothetical protein